ncbi:MAG: matrixin family metalloprotease [Armatimonadetes bacterium]|nr:matrixin family metalloprotease [Armatimonadota bacterium]
MNLGLGRLGAAVSMCAVVATCLAVSGAHLRYLQPKMVAELAKAASQVEAGSLEEADARLDLVLVRGKVNISLDTARLTIAERVAAEKAFADAVDMWRQELGDDVTFQVVPQEMAQVRFRWSDGQAVGGRCAGHAVWSRQVWRAGEGFRSDLSADVELALYGSDGGNLPQESLVQAAAHELGHILGMDDTGRRGDLMGPVRPGRPVSQLSSHEREALDALRSEGKELAQVCLLQRLSMSW